MEDHPLTHQKQSGLDLAISINVPQKLSEIGVKKDDLENLAVSAFNDICTPGNPRDTNVDEILATKLHTRWIFRLKEISEEYKNDGY